MRMLIRPGGRLLLLVLLAAACTTTPAATPERVAAVKAQAKACQDRLPAGYRYEVDRFAVVTVRGLTPGPALNTDTFNDCVFGAGKWKDPVATPPAVRPSGSPAQVSPTSRTADRLKELDSLRQQQLISDEEYQATRKRILEGL
jgi:hypothetical protein